jgi:hypothetical protein
MIKSQQHSGQRRYRAVIYSFRRPLMLLAFLLIALWAFFLAQQIIRRTEGAEPAAVKAKQPPPTKTGEGSQATKPAEDRYAWRKLFDGKTLQGWKSAAFGGEGEVKVADGAMVMGTGNNMTGLTWTGKPPRLNYELKFEGKRTGGSDFFATTTFPVGDAYCSLVLGGWGGTVVGLSCVDFYDASDNATTKFKDFQTNHWYDVRIRVTKAKIEAWIDEEQVVDFEAAGHRLSIRDECDLCRPLGFATWCTEGAVRNVRLRELRPEDVSEDEPAGETKK